MRILCRYYCFYNYNLLSTPTTSPCTSKHSNKFFLIYNSIYLRLCVIVYLLCSKPPLHSITILVETTYLKPQFLFMETLPTSTLSSLNPLSSHFKVAIKIDRIFNNEHVWIVGPRRSPMKELISVDIVIFDNEGPLSLFHVPSS